MFGFIQDAWLTIKQWQVAIHGPDIKQDTPEGTACLVEEMKATVRSFYPGKGDHPTPSMNASGTPHMKQLVCFTCKHVGLAL